MKSKIAFVPAAVAGLMFGFADPALGSASPATALGICDRLDTYPSSDGVTLVVFDLMGAGYSPEQGAKVLVQTVAGQCPEYLPLLQTWARSNG